MGNIKIKGFLLKLVQKGIRLSERDGKLSLEGNLKRLTDDDKAFLSQHKAEVLAFINQFAGKKAKKADASSGQSAKDINSIMPAEKRELWPLSFDQQRLWLLYQMEPQSHHYHMTLSLQLEGELNVAALQQSVDSLIERHHILRSVYANSSDGEPVQKVLTESNAIKIAITQLEIADAAQLAQVEKDYSEKPFDLTAECPIRVTLVKISEQLSRLWITVHHIACDGWSQALLSQELMQLYQAFNSSSTVNAQAILPPLALQYYDYAVWQKQQLTQQALNKQLDYWKNQLAQIPACHDLPLDRPRPAVATNQAALIKTSLSTEQLAKMNALASEHGTTLFMVLQTAYAVLLSLYSNSDDIVLGAPIANKDQPELANVVGFFVNSLVLRTRFQANPRLVDVLKRNATNLLEAYQHKTLPFDQLVDALAPPRANYNPLFQVMLVLDNQQQADIQLPGLKVSTLAGEARVAKFDMTLTAVENNSGLQLDWWYVEELFNQSTVEQMAQAFERLLDSWLANPQLRLSEFSLLDAKRAQALLNQQMAVQLPTDLVHQLFEQQAAKNPQAVALVYQQKALSYQQLNQRANQLAHGLIAKGVKPDAIVALNMPRSIEWIVAILAVLKAGGAYLSLDQANPAARNQQIIDDSAAHMVLNAADIADISSENDENPSVAVTTNHLAYVIYTSGSTGKPKGVMLEHGGLSNTCISQIEQFEVEQTSRVLQFAAAGFDAATSEWAMALASGASLVIADDEQKQNAQQLDSLAYTTKVTHATIPPALLDYLERNSWQSMTHLIVAGEACALATAKLWAQGRVLFNAYGPSEATICASIGRYDGNSPWLTIGTAINNTQLLVLDEQMRPVADGVCGELYIVGAGLARGYINNQALTDQVFLPSIAGQNAPQRAYRSGDMVRRLADGQLLFVGRKADDNQVKIRGYRIELGEIEQQMMTLESVRSVAVIAHQQQLVAFVVSAQALPAVTSQLKQHLSQQLPEYMQPERYIAIEQLPLTVNGKLDSNKLQQLADAEFEQAVTVEFVAPSNDIEAKIAEMMADLLKLERFSVAANFFAFGGNSLMATRLVGQIEQQLAVKLKVADIFAGQTAKQVAMLVSNQLTATTSQHAPSIKIDTAPDDAKVPLSFAQMRLWLTDQIEANHGQYNIPGVLSLKGNLNVEALEQALNAIVARHQILRTVYVEDGQSGAHQQVLADAQLTLTRLDLSHQPSQASLEQLINSEAAAPFDLSCDLMLRASLIELASDDYVLLITMHHIASDGWSMSILTEELAACYQAYLHQQSAQLPALNLQYRDYAYWQHQPEQQQLMAQQVSYWQQQLADIPTVHSLPLDRPRGATADVKGRLFSTKVDATTTKALNQLAQNHDASLFMLLNAAMAVLVGRYSGEQDIVLGTLMANREHPDLAPLVGFFVNVLALRTDLSGQPSFNELLAQSKQTLLDAYAHQQVPFEQVIDAIEPARTLSHHPVFQIMLILQNNPQAELTLEQVQLTAMAGSEPVALYDLTLNVLEANDELTLNFEYATSLFDSDSIERMAQSFVVLLQGIVKTPETAVSRLPLLAETQKQQVLQSWNNTDFAYDKSLCVHHLFEQQLANHSDKPAVIFQQQQLTYGQLNAKANQLARYIQQQGVGPDVLVGLCVERSLEMTIGILAILKAGGTLVPLDPKYPQERLAYMIAASDMPLVLTLTGQKPLLPTDQACLCLDSQWSQSSELTELSEDNLNASVEPQHLAAVFYTSGSTGKPKGAEVPHGTLVNFAYAMRDTLNFDANDRFLQLASISFDVLFEELLPTWLSGAAVVLPPADFMPTPDALQQITEQQQVTCFELTTALWHEWVHQLCVSGAKPAAPLHTVLMGGERVLPERFREWQSFGLRLIHVYGLTEVAVTSTVLIDDGNSRELSASATLPIGKPLYNTQIYLLSEQGQPVPIGVAGEMYICGDGLARGYRNQPQLTAEKFVDHPFIANTRAYRTGDLARYLPSGDIEFIGRVDHQVKVRGFRIELNEINEVITSQPWVAESLVVLREDEPGDKRICAYLALNSSELSQLEAKFALKDVIARELPDYMMPAAFVVLDKLPLTPNGKIDRKALPAPDWQQLQTSEYRAPQNELQQQLVDIWQQVLDIEKLGIDDNFFDLGGHSLLATRVIAKVREQLAIDFPIRLLFEQQTVAQLAESLAELEHGANQASEITTRIQTNDEDEVEMEDFEL